MSAAAAAAAARSIPGPTKASLLDLLGNVEQILKRSITRQSLNELKSLSVQILHIVNTDLAAAAHAEKDTGPAIASGDRIILPMSARVHNLRTPLNSIITNLFSLEELSDEQLLDPSEVLDHIKVGFTEVGEIIRNLPNEGESLVLKLEQSPLNVRSVLNHVIAILSGEAIGKGKILSISPETLERPEYSQELLGDKRKIQEVLINFVGNAIKFAKSDPNIILSARVVGGNLEFSVEDRGPGLSDEDKANLGTKFLQLGDTPRSATESTGLGVYGSLQYIRLMGGTFSVRDTNPSPENPGLTVQFTVPYLIAPPKQAPRDVKSPFSLTFPFPISTIFGDDDIVARKTTERLLKKVGEKVNAPAPVICKSGEDVVEAYKSNFFDVCIVDMDFGENGTISGLETAIQVHQLAMDRFGKSPYFIICSGATEQIDLPPGLAGKVIEKGRESAYQMIQAIISHMIRTRL